MCATPLEGLACAGKGHSASCSLPAFSLKLWFIPAFPKLWSYPAGEEWAGTAMLTEHWPRPRQFSLLSLPEPDLEVWEPKVTGMVGTEPTPTPQFLITRGLCQLPRDPSLLLVTMEAGGPQRGAPLPRVV